jgi:hypothetical protein
LKTNTTPGHLPQNKQDTVSEMAVSCVKITDFYNEAILFAIAFIYFDFTVLAVFFFFWGLVS